MIKFKEDIFGSSNQTLTKVFRQVEIPVWESFEGYTTIVLNQLEPFRITEIFERPSRRLQRLIKEDFRDTDR